MTQAAAAPGLLSRDEMDALLDELATARREEAEQRALYRARPPEDPHRGLRRDLEAFGEAYAKRLSTIYQRRIEWILRDTLEVAPADLIETSPQGDLFWGFECGAGQGGWVGWNRSLVFAWLQIAFGATEPRGLTPERPYTAIERSFLARLGQEAVELLGPTLSALGAEPAGDGSLQEPADLLALAGARVVQAYFEVRGFGDLGRVRIALANASGKTQSAAGSGVRRGVSNRGQSAVLKAPVSMRAEVGSAEISVASLAALRAGDVLPLRTERDGTLLLTVSGVAKFRARRGSVGERLAVQVTERIGESR